MIKVIEKYLMVFAVLDFTCQIICQMPIIYENDYMRYIGFRKIWKEPDTGFTYSNYVLTGNHNYTASLSM